jgi:hypothetical protein
MADPNGKRGFHIPVGNMDEYELRAAYFSQMNTLGDSKAKLVKSKAYNLVLGTNTPISATFVNDTKSLLHEVKAEYSKRGIPLPAYKPLKVRYEELKAIEEQARKKRMRLFAGKRAGPAVAVAVAAAPPMAAGGEGDPRPVIFIPESPPVAAGGAGGGGGGAGGGAGGAPWGGNSAESTPGLPIPGLQPPMHPPFPLGGAGGGGTSGMPPMHPSCPPGSNAKPGCAIAGGKRRTYRKRKNHKKRVSRKM